MNHHKLKLLFLSLLALFVVDMFVPDPIPLVDEIALGIATLVAGFKLW